MPIIKNPIHGRLPLPVPKELSKKPSLLEMVKEAIDENNIRVDIPELKDVFKSGDYIIPNDYLKRGPTSYYSKDNTFIVPSITDFVRLTVKDCHEPMFYMRDPLSDIWNRIANRIGIQHDEKKFVYVDKHGKVKLSDPEQKYSRDFIIQPIFSFAGCPEVFNLLTNNGKDEYVYFGETPKNAVPKDTQETLEYAYKKGTLTKLKETFPCDKTLIWGRNADKKPFHKIDYPVYEYKGERYIRFKVTQNPVNPKYIFQTRLSNYEDYANGDYVWIKVSPIYCKVNAKDLTLVSQQGIIGGIQYLRPRTTSNLFPYEFLNYYSNILKYPEHFLKKKINEEEKRKHEESKDEILSIINTIKDYKKYYFGEENIDEKIKKLLTDYNSKLDELERKVDSDKPMLTVGEFKPSFIHKKLISDLEDILNKLKEYYEDYKEYFALIELLELCQEGIIDDDNDYLCRYCHDLKNSFIDSIKNPDRREKLDDEFNSIIDNYINEVYGYLKKSIKPAMVIDSLKNNLTFDLGKWKDSSLIKAMFTDAKEDNIKTMVNDINTAHDEILKNGSEEDIKLCEEYMAKLNKINVNGVLPAVLRQLENILVPLHKINYRIGERRVSHEEIDKYRTKANPETIFDDEPIKYSNMR